MFSPNPPQDMAAVIRKLFGRLRRGSKKKYEPRKDSITGRNHTFPVPYLSRLEGNQLQPGQSLIVRGTIIGRDEFLINLTSGARVELDEETATLDNRLLSIRVDIPAKRVYLNACIDGEWGKEGVIKHIWSEGDDFDIRVRCREEAFDIYMDWKLVAEFKHYVPISNISHFYINGDVELFSVSWEGKFYQLPYMADIPGHFMPGRKLHVSASLPKKARSFSVRLHGSPPSAVQNGVNGSPAPEDDVIAIEVSPSIASKKIVRHARVKGEWTAAEKKSDCGFPLKRGRLFDIILACNDSRIMIYVDDLFVGAFDHRVPPAEISKISIDGEIDLHAVHLK